MATQAEILQALRNAHNAGDTAAAQRLAKMYKMGQEPDTGLMTGIKDSTARIGQGIVDFLPTVTDAITGVKDARIVFGNGSGELDMGDFVPRIMTAKEADDLGATNPFGFSGNEFSDAATAIGRYREGLNYGKKVPWQQVKDDPSFENIAVFMGESAVTSLPDMAAALLSTPAYFASYVAPIAKERAQNDGRDEPNREDLIAAVSAAGVIATAERIGAKGIFKGKPSQAVGGRIASAGAKEMATEAVQSPVEYAGGTVGTEAGFDPAVALDQAAAGAVGGLGAGAGIRGTIETGAAVGNVINPKMKGEDQEAAADLARDLRAIAEEKGLNLKDTNVDSTTGGRAAMDDLHSSYTNEVNAILAELRPLLSADVMDSLETRTKKILQKAGVKKAKNKVKSTADPKEIDAVRDLVGKYSEGQQLVSLMRKLDEMTRLRSGGFKGGVSQFTDILNPLASAGNYNAARNTVRGVVGLGTGAAATSTGGASLIPQIGAVGAGRAIDALTGRRARVAKFVRDNQGRAGIGQTNAPSFIAQRQAEIRRQEAEAEREAQRRAFEAARNEAERAAAAGRLSDAQRAVSGSAPNMDSPLGKVMMGTGLDLQGVLDAINIVESSYPALAKYAKELRTSIERGGRISDEALGPLIRGIGQAVIDNANLHGRVVRTPDNDLRAEQYRDKGIINDNPPTPDIDPNEGLTPAQRRGKAANIAYIKTIQAQIDADSSLSPPEKDALKQTLDVYADTNLGQDPVTFIQEDMGKLVRYLTSQGVEAGRAQETVDKYIGNYLDRVRKQQAAGQKKKPDPDPEPTPEPPLNPEPTTPILTEGDGTNDINSGNPRDGDEGAKVQPPQPAPDTEAGKKVSEATQALVEVGKEGSKYENGLSDLEAAKTITEALGFKFIEIKTLDELRKTQREYRLDGDATLGLFDPAKKALWAYTGSELPPSLAHVDDKRTPLDAIGTVMHELGHLLDMRNSPPSFVPSQRVRVLGRLRSPNKGDLFTEALAAILPKNSYDMDRMVLSREIRAFQRSRLSSGNPELQATATDTRLGLVRSFFGRPENVQRSSRGVNFERGYLSDPHEMTADALMGYMMNPKQFKKDYPTTARFIRNTLSKDKELSKTIKFYSATPLLAVAAVLSTLFAEAGEEDEDQGILTAPKGALTT